MVGNYLGQGTPLRKGGLKMLKLYSQVKQLIVLEFVLDAILITLHMNMLLFKDGETQTLGQDSPKAVEY